MSTRRTDKRGPDRKLGDGSSHVGALPHPACNQDFRRLADSTPDPRSVSNIKLALERLGVKRGDRVNTGNLFARIADDFGLKPVPELRRKTLRWLADRPSPEVKRWLSRTRSSVYPNSEVKQMKKDQFDDLVTTAEAPALTGYSLDTIRTYRAVDSDFPAVARKIGTTNLFRRADLLAWKKRHEARIIARRMRRA